MKIEGEVGQLKAMLEKCVCDGLFNTVTLRVQNDAIISRMSYEGIAGAFLQFDMFDISGDDDMDEMVRLDGAVLLAQLKPVNDKERFTITIDNADMLIVTEREKLIFHLDDDYADGRDYIKDCPFNHKDGSVYIGDKTELDIKFVTTAQELSEVVTRMNVNKLGYVTFTVQDGTIDAVIGDLKSTRKHPRVYHMKGMLEAPNAKDGEGVCVETTLEKIVSVLSGEVDMVTAVKDGVPYPMLFYEQNEDKGYELLYVLSPSEVVE